MARREEYRRRLRRLKRWEPFLLRESGLPGPRANLELLQAVADEGTTERFRTLLESAPEHVAGESRKEFLAACGAVGLGESIARGDPSLWPRLRALAADSRWRVREGVAMGLQRVGDRDMGALLRQVERWMRGGPLERRAVAAGLCEPRLLTDRAHARAVVRILDDLTRSLTREPDRRNQDVRTLRQALGYCWSVAIAACPSEGKKRFERFAAMDDPDVRWVVRENLGKKRLQRLDAAWVDRLRKRVS
jgi:hypothetical protein